MASLLGLAACGPRDTDSVKQAHFKNINSSIDADVSEFMTEAADARMLAIEEGKLASKKGSTQQIREYGELMVRDQSRILEELKLLAVKRNITLPVELSHKRQRTLASLDEKEGEAFDKKFLEVASIDHKREVSAFRKASGFKDSEVAGFAEKNLNLIRYLHEGARSIQKGQPMAEGEPEKVD